MNSFCDMCVDLDSPLMNAIIFMINYATKVYMDY